jgi:hypothetical protein
MISEYQKYWDATGTISSGDSTHYYFHAFPVGINDLTRSLEDLIVYPNPTTANLTVKTTAQGLLSIQNTNGQQLLQQEINEPNTTINVSGWNSGVYFVKVVGEKGVHVGKFIKN